jgi:hypothetical protein
MFTGKENVKKKIVIKNHHMGIQQKNFEYCAELRLQKRKI